MRWMLFVVLGISFWESRILRADIVNLANGDRFIGSVQLVNEKEVHLKNDAVGVLKVPREKVTSIFFGTNSPSASVSGDVASSPWKTPFDPKSIEQVQKDFLATATPEANAMFTDLVQGLATGKMSLDDIRKQAADSLKELKELQSELGEEADNPLLSGYLGILEKFIQSGTNRSAPPFKPAPKRVLPGDEE